MIKIMKKIVIIGAGPAGLTSGLILSQAGFQVMVYEADPQYVGGLSKTIEYKGYRFDIGGHRFYSKDQEVRSFWQQLMGNDLLLQQRSSRIYYKRKLLRYPLDLGDILFKLPPSDFISFIASWIKSQLKPPRAENNFESWMIARFGEKLFNAFFKTYTEKVWGRECRHISSDWADQRIQNLSIWEVFKSFFNKTQVKSMTQTFEYPKLGPGMLWERVMQEVRVKGGTVELGIKVKSLHQQEQGWEVLTECGQRTQADFVINSMPLTNLLKSINNTPENILELARGFEYRAFITVAIMFKGKNPFTEQWIYIQEPSVLVGRIQNYQNWSPFMVPTADHCCLGLEYFCQFQDELWMKTDFELFELAIRELDLLDISYSKNELDFKVIRQPYAYPIYDLDYQQRLAEIRAFLKEQTNLYSVGRSGLHRYNNQDHSIKTAMLVCENIIRDQFVFDPWMVNQDAEYIEEVSDP